MSATRRQPSERLEAYRAKRDFTITSEPAGTSPPSDDGHRFVVQRHRARRLHYDLRLEAGGVLVSWAVPKGPTLDPAVRRMAVHVEDHPLDYFDFEGVIPEGEYGGGDVIVWDWGTWEAGEAPDPLAAVEAGDLHFDLHGEKLHGRFVLVRRDGDGGPGGAGKGQWLLLKKKDDDAVPGWDPEQHPRSVKSGRTNDEVKASPSATWSSTASWVGPTADELDALDALPKAGTWHLGDHTLQLTNLDTVLFPARAPHPALTKRDLVRHNARMAPVMLPYLADRPVELHRFPKGVDEPGSWRKAVPSRAPDWITRWRERIVIDSPAALAWVANDSAVELRPSISTTADPHRTSWALIDIDPDRDAEFDEVLVLARLHRTALDHLQVEARPVLTGERGIEIWIPVADRSTFDETQNWVDALTRAIGDTVPDLAGRVRLDSGRNAIDTRLVAPFSTRPAPGAPVAVPIAWVELDDPELGADRWTVPDIGARLSRVGDPLAPLIGLQQRLPRL